MKNHALGFLSVLFLWGLLLTMPAAAQETRWVQVEAHSTLRDAQDAAAGFQGRFGNVSGFRLPSGWYAIVLGPFETADDANAVRRQLAAERAIPRDSFVSDGASYGVRFWPPGAGARAADLPSGPDAAPETDPQTALVPPLDVIEEEPEETLREAQRSEAALTRDERAALQVALQWFGFYTQAIDAAFGPGTRRAMQGWQQDRGFDATGVLTTRQREQLIREYSGELAALGMDQWRDERAGIEIELPLALVEFDRLEAPFVHFRPRDDSGVQVLLLSQSGTQATLHGLYEIMQTLEIVPLDGERQRRQNGFLPTGQNDTLRSHTVAELRNGQIKGYTLVWTPERDDQMARVLPMMEASFATFGDTLPDSAGQASAVQRRDLMAGLAVRRPERSRSGFYIDAAGTVLTSFDAVAACERVTIDEVHTARIAATDPALGIALLRPEVPLVPLAFAQFANGAPRLMSEVAVSGFSYEEALTRPLLSFGQLADARGLEGEDDRFRLDIGVLNGDVGGPVFGSDGAVIGLLLPQDANARRQLPVDTHFAASADALRVFMAENGVRFATLAQDADQTPERLTRLAPDLTVMVSCWN